ncbi:hypothetical protein [Micromonospora zingiberis]|uniref:hypothetical protein n=1 Tax=Micromonospora zingiberis TaxID=2053011 RepID=UPI001F0FF3B4|nr:hypothetical protein [Micromonospora zingiberis]
MPDTAAPPRSLPELRALAAAGGRIKYLFSSTPLTCTIRWEMTHSWAARNSGVSGL